MDARPIVLVLSAVLGLAFGCLLTLDDEMACGDGYTDRNAGEECDPRDHDSFIGGCQGIGDPKRPGACTDDCKLDSTVCFPRCGNGIVDEDEECDVADLGGLVQPTPCTELPPPLADFKTAYVGGESVTCTTDTCLRLRDGCHYCGDGIVDSDYEHYPERCDRNDFDKNALHDRCKGLCNVDAFVDDDAAVRCNVDCSDDCRELVPQDELGCCLAPGEPINEDILPCCFAPAPGDTSCPLRPI